MSFRPLIVGGRPVVAREYWNKFIIIVTQSSAITKEEFDTKKKELLDL